MNIFEIVKSYQYNDIKNLKRLKRRYKENLKALKREGATKYKRVHSTVLDYKIDKLELKHGIKLCNEYIKFLEKRM